MSPEEQIADWKERVAKHEKSIADIREDMDITERSNLTVNAGPKLLGNNNAEIIEDLMQELEIYEGFIAKLKKQIADA